MLLSGLPLATGLVAFLLLIFIGKKSVISVDSSKSSIKLILNITNEDFEKGKLSNLERLGNYIYVEIAGNRKGYEISSGQVNKLLSQYETKSWDITFQKRKVKSLDGPPKELFDSAMGILWGAT